MIDPTGIAFKFRFFTKKEGWHDQLIDQQGSHENESAKNLHWSFWCSSEIKNKIGEYVIIYKHLKFLQNKKIFQKNSIFNS